MARTMTTILILVTLGLFAASCRLGAAAGITKPIQTTGEKERPVLPDSAKVEVEEPSPDPVESEVPQERPIIYLLIAG